MKNLELYKEIVGPEMFGQDDDGWCDYLDDFIEDMNRVNTANIQDQPQTSGPVEKGDITGQTTRQNTTQQRNQITTANNRPITKNRRDDFEVNNNIEENFEEDERSTDEQHFE